MPVMIAPMLTLRWFGVLVLLFPLAASADWPAHRHDAQRTAIGGRASAIVTPAPFFRAPIGGTLRGEQYVAHDVDGDGRREMIFVMGGAVRAKTADDAVRWETAALDAERIDGLVDLTGDGAPELVVTAAAGRLYVIDPDTGTNLWSLPSGIVGAIGNVLFHDFDGDGVTDLYFSFLACGNSAYFADIARAYDFSDDVAAPTQLFELERGGRDYLCGRNNVVADVDGDGAEELVVQGTRHVYVYSTSTGALESTSADIGSIPYSQAQVAVADIDDDPAAELLLFTEANYAPSVNSRRVFALDWDDVGGRLDVRWNVSVPDLTADRHGFGGGGVADLDGDGDLEVVTSFFSGATDRWRMFALDAATGAELASTPAGPFQGLVDVDGDGRPEAIAGNVGTGGVEAYSLGGGAFSRLFRLADASVLLRAPLADRRQGTFTRQPVAMDLDEDGDLELLVALGGTRNPSAIVGVAAGSDPPMEVARLTWDADVSLLTADVFTDVTRPGAQLVFARSDGYLWVLDRALAPTNVAAGGEIPRRGLRTGGFYAPPTSVGLAPLAADVDGDGTAEILVRDSQQRFHLLSASGASLLIAPTVRWTQPALRGLFADLAGDPEPEIVLLEATDVGHDITVRNADGTVRWQRAVGTPTTVVDLDLVAGDVSGDGVPDIAFTLRDLSNGDGVYNVLSGVNGTPLWASDYRTRVAGSGNGALGLYDLDGAPGLEVVAAPRNLRSWLATADGNPVREIDAGYSATVVPAETTAGSLLVTTGAVHGTRALRQDLTASVWTSNISGPERTSHTRNLGAIVDCGGSPRLLQGYYLSPRLSAWDAADGTVVQDVGLRGGIAYDDPAAVPGGPGVLGNLTVSPDLIGDGRPAVLVPSSDGYLYALDACDLENLLWTLNFRVQVGEAVLADVDGDGLDEILVTVADGYLYGVDQEVLPPPAFVVETARLLPDATEADDIDEIVARDTLYAAWAPVAGATSYEYAVITPGGAFLTDPPFVSVGTETSATASLLPLTAGQTYHFAVRAIGPDGSSREALSDGVRILPDPCDACAATEICVEGTCVPDPCLGVTCGEGEVCSRGSCVPVGSTDVGVPPGLDAGTTPPPEMGGDGACCSVTPGASRSGDLPALALLLLLGLAVVIRRR